MGPQPLPFFGHRGHHRLVIILSLIWVIAPSPTMGATPHGQRRIFFHRPSPPDHHHRFCGSGVRWTAAGVRGDDTGLHFHGVRPTRRRPRDVFINRAYAPLIPPGTPSTAGVTLAAKCSLLSSSRRGTATASPQRLHQH